MDENKYGCTLNNPVRLSMVADEYYLLEKMHHLKGGTIIDVQRIGTQWNAETEHIIDVWEVKVLIGKKRKNYKLFFDPYFYKPFENFEITAPDDFKFETDETKE